MYHLYFGECCFTLLYAYRLVNLWPFAIYFTHWIYCNFQVCHLFHSTECIAVFKAMRSHYRYAAPAYLVIYIAYSQLVWWCIYASIALKSEIVKYIFLSYTQHSFMWKKKLSAFVVHRIGTRSTWWNGVLEQPSHLQFPMRGVASVHASAIANSPLKAWMHPYTIIASETSTHEYRKQITN
jgi:hypothetical protein